jgi:putative DNA primase/helicase
MTNGADEIRKQVQERVDQEAAQVPPQDEEPKITREFINECLFANELGDGTFYSVLFRNKFLFCKNRAKWFEWSGNYWTQDDMGRASAAVEQVVEYYLAEYKRVASALADLLATGGDLKSDTAQKMKDKKDALLTRARQLRGSRRRANCLEFAHTIENPIAITGDEFDNKPMLFPCANGVIDLETGRLKPGLPGDYITLASPVEFTGIDTPAPIWERTLLEIYGDKNLLVSYLQRLLGYSMTGLISEKIFPVLYGRTGWNGRSLIIETVSHVMGSLAGSIPSEMLLSQKFGKNSSGTSSDIMSLKGLRMAFASEVDENQKFSAAKIKWLTGRDELVGRNPYDKEQTRFYPTHKLFLMTNTQPEAPANDKSFWERLHLIPHLISFVNRDPKEAHELRADLKRGDQLLKESSGILAWLVRGCLSYQQLGINPPKEITEATEEYRKGEDILADFIDECCFIEPGAGEKAAVLYSRFVEWWHENIGQIEKSGTWFGKQLKQKFTKSKVNGCIHYAGIGLKVVKKKEDDQGELDS